MNTPCAKSHMYTCGSRKELSECQMLSVFPVWLTGCSHSVKSPGSLW